MSTRLTIALTKGRILTETLPLLRTAGIEPQDDIATSRKLIFATNKPNVRLVVLRGADVTTYVRHGVADLGVAGKDMLLEYGCDDLYELLELNIARCRLMTAARKGVNPQGRRRTVASKFVNIAKRYYAEQGINADIVKLYGALELAPLLDLADEIVDIVDTGNTLKANGLEPRQLIAPVSACLIVNKAAMKIKHRAIHALVAELSAAVGLQ